MMSFQILVSHAIEFCATDAAGRGVSFCSIWTTLPLSIRYALTTAMASRSLTQL